MPIPRSFALAALALLAGTSLPAPQDGGAPADAGAPADGGERPAESRSEAIAKSSFRWAQSADGGWVLVATIEPAPGWHVYWTNPGDSGSAPSFQLTLPDGWRAGKTVYPRPEVRTIDGTVFYGYAHAAHYLVPVRRTDALSADSWPSRSTDGGADGDAGAGRWKVRAKVMACKERCVMASLSAAGDWPPTADAGTDLRLDGGSFGGRALPAKAATAGVFARLEDDRVRIEGPARGHSTVRFIPADVPGMQVDLPDGAAAIEGTVTGDSFRIMFPLKSQGAGPGEPALAGLVLLGNAPTDPCVWVSIPHPLAGPEGPLGAGDGNGGGVNQAPPN